MAYKQQNPSRSASPPARGPWDHAAVTPGFVSGLSAFQRWRDELAEVIAEYQSWVEHHEGAEETQGLHANDLLETLRSDKLVIAVMGEYSRGKTELLNAIFFADQGTRLMPSAAGRTTMCPVELRYDEKVPPCVRLLPIETRKTALTLAEYGHSPAQWTTRHILKPGSAPEWREAFLELTRTRTVDALEAWELGLLRGDPRSELTGAAIAQVTIPVWRHAVVNYPHPLLRDGLVILDTPGLNALGVEPELAFAMLPDAHALLFLVSADAGVTKTDLEMWKSCGPGRGHADLRIVVLNKIDILWDELHDPDAIKQMIARQVAETARALHVDPRNVFPASAQKAFAGKVKADTTLLSRSGLLEIEHRLANEVIPTRHLILRERVMREISNRVESSRALIESRLATQKQHLAGLRSLSGKSSDVIQRMAGDMRSQKRAYDRAVEGFQATRAALAEKTAVLLGSLDADSLERLTKQVLADMNESWTTAGLKRGMEAFFRDARLRMDQAGSEAVRIKQLVEEIYDRLHREYLLPKFQPATLSPVPFLIELARLEKKAEAFRNSAAMLMTERHFVVNRFFITLVGETRRLFREYNDASSRWLQELISPLFTHIQQHKTAINDRLADLKRIHGNMDRLGERIRATEDRVAQLEEERRGIDDLFKRLHQHLS
ncbi:MAG: dynamin family protein [Acidiferrobacteraceae bacterium]